MLAESLTSSFGARACSASLVAISAVVASASLLLRRRHRRVLDFSCLKERRVKHSPDMLTSSLVTAFVLPKVLDNRVHGLVVHTVKNRIGCIQLENMRTAAKDCGDCDMIVMGRAPSSNS
jgi:hypothetical protein